MKTVSLPWSSGSWRNALTEVFSDIDDLLAELGLTRDRLGLTARADEAAYSFRLRVPRGYVARMRWNDPNDPLLRQVLPSGLELDRVPGYAEDPLDEGGAGGSLLHKYRGRALMLTTVVCAINCRYCFRRHFPSNQSGHVEQALGLVESDQTIEEVILSGGDPLIMSDDRLGRLMQDLSAIGHVRRIRIHSRLPIVLPQRIDRGFLDVIEGVSKPVVMVMHANHAQEIDGDVEAACAALAEHGVTLLNQSVLLAGVNDSVSALTALSERLFDCAVLPYYLHLLDPVAGAAHFDVGEDRARGLFAELCASLPGYLVPRLVREVPSTTSKVIIAPRFFGVARDEDK